jgi:hypothetical protein
MAPKLVKTRTRGIYRRGSRYVVVWQHKGRQHKEFFATMAEAREAKARRQGGERRKIERVRFEDYAERWIESYRGRTSRGFSETTRTEYRRDVDARLIPYFRGYRLDEVEPQDVKAWLGWLESRGESASAIRKGKATLPALMGDALEEGKVRFNPVLGVRYVSGFAVNAESHSRAPEVPRRCRRRAWSWSAASVVALTPRGAPPPAVESPCEAATKEGSDARSRRHGLDQRPRDR